MSVFKKMVFIVIFIFFVGICYSADPSIYIGKWISINNDYQINIVLKNLKLIIEKVVVKKKKLKNFRNEFLYGEDAIVPFLFIYSEEENVGKGYVGYEHKLYLTLGSSDTNDNFNLIKGFYEFSKIRDDHHCTMEIEFYPVELRKVIDIKKGTMRTNVEK